MHDHRSTSGPYLLSARPDARPPTLWQRIVGGVVLVAVFALALTVSIALFAVVLTVGAIVWGYLWWKTRDLRRAIREQMAAGTAGGDMGPGTGSGPGAAHGVVIEGEVVREVEVVRDETGPDRASR
jgi:hypothetical protein